MTIDDALRNGTLSRRDLLRYGAGAGAAIGATGLLAACGGGSSTDTDADAEAKPRRGGTAKLAMNAFSSQDTLDPALNFYLSGLLANGLFYDTLLKTDNQWKLTPNLAEDYTASSDNKTWTFKIRRGVEFHSGGVLTSADVVASILRILDPEVGSIGGLFFAPVLTPDGIKAVDPTTVRFSLTQPDAFFGQRVASNYSRIHKKGAAFKTSEGTGPFKSVTFRGGQGFEAVRNDSYWEEGRPYLDAVNFVATPDGATTTQAVLSGDADFSDVPNYSIVPQLESSATATALTDPFGFAYDIEINQTVKPYSDPAVRMAIKQLIDRKKYVEVAFKGQATVTNDSYVNPGDPFYPTDFEPPAFDPEAAKAALERAGAAGTKVEINTASLGGTSDLAVLFRESLLAGGLDASVKQMTPAEFDKTLGVAPVAVTYWQRFHPALVLPYYYASDGMFNYGKVNVPKIDALLKSMLSRKTLDEQKEDIGEIQRLYATNAATLWPVHSKALWAHKKRLQGLIAHPTEVVDFRQAFIV